MGPFPLISVVIPVYNRKEYLKKCIKSIESQQYRNYEIIIVDDGSTDNLEEIKLLCHKYIRNQINLGPSYSRNVGVLHSKGEILLFLDSDVKLLPDSLINLPKIFNNDERIGAIGGEGPPNDTEDNVKLIYAGRYSFFGRKIPVKHIPISGNSLHKTVEVDIAASAFLAVRSDLFYLIGGFDPYLYYLCEDRDLCFNLKEHNYSVVISSEVKAIHYWIKDHNAFKLLPKKKFDIFYYRKQLEVAIKWKGVQGGIRWLMGNFRISLRPHYFFILLRQFLNSKLLVKRKKVNFLDPNEKEKFIKFHSINYLKRALPFKLNFPLPTPVHFILFVTSKCNARCVHCFLSGIPVIDDEISPGNIIKLFGALKKPVESLNITGGEPFLREDLGLIVNSLMKLKSIRSLSIATNGSLPEKIEAICKSACSSYSKQLSIQISLDGLQQTHDSTRNISRGFDKVMETCRRLKEIRKSHPQLAVVINIMIMKHNLTEIDQLISYLETNKLASKLNIVRGNFFSTFGVPADLLNAEYNPRNPVAPSLEEIRRLLAIIEEKHPAYFDSFQKEKLKVMLDTLTLKRRLIPCYAGYEDAVIYNDGSIGLCEQVVPFGKLADWKWDFSKAWNSSQAMIQRVRLSACACIHGCNVVTSLARKREKELKYIPHRAFNFFRKKVENRL